MNRKKLSFFTVVSLLSAFLVCGCGAAGRDTARMWAKWKDRQAAAVGTPVLAAEMDFASVPEESVIPAGIDIDGVDVGGLTIPQAHDQLQAYYEQQPGFNVTLLWEGEPVGVMDSRELGMYHDGDSAIAQAIAAGSTGGALRRYRASSDIATGRLHIEAPMKIDGAAVESFVQTVSDENVVAPVDATITRKDGEFVVTDSVDGYAADISATAAMVRQGMLTADGDVAVEVVMESVAPKYSAEELRKIKDVLGTYTTHYNKVAPTREHNVQLATSRFNGLVLLPGESASADVLMKPRTTANGYRYGHIYVNGSVENGIGGGVCQVASTLYNALLLAEIQIDERHNHSMVVSYLQPGRDATIAAGSDKDLKFTNNLDNPIYIGSYSDGVEVKFTVYGVETRPENRKIDYPVTVVYDEVTSRGREREVYLEKVVYIDDVEVSREKLHQDYYAPS